MNFVLRHRMHHLGRPSQSLSTLDNMGECYTRDRLRFGPEKTHKCVYQKQRSHPNVEQLVVQQIIEHTPTYLGVILDRTLIYSTHIAKCQSGDCSEKQMS